MMLPWLLLAGFQTAPSVITELKFAPNKRFSLALEGEKVALKVSAAKTGTHWEIWVDASENGKNLIGTDSRFQKDRYRHVLDGRYSLIAKQPDGLLKVIQDSLAGTVKVYWGYQETIAGKKVSGWTEFAPIPLPNTGNLQVKTDGQVEIRPVDRSLPTQDNDDRKTGFKATKRKYHWSGTDGEAWVVTFGDRCKWRSQDVKLVFPEQGAWVPGYQLSNKHMVQFEFLETWGGGAKGCYEPMSDRVNRFSKVELIEDRQDRKTLRWTYQLINPDYVRWGEPLGSKQDPLAEEIWTIYPDGSAKRVQRYWAPLDTAEEQHSLGTQVAEFDVVWASNVIPEDVTPKQAATVFAPRKQLPIEYPSQRKPSDPLFSGEKVFGIAAHSLDPNLPDVFAVFDQKGALNPPYQISTDDVRDWHRERFWRFCHFPFNNEPFMYETNSQAEGRGQITHSSLVYVGAPTDRNWESQWKKDAGGRKYREWTTTVGLAKPRDFEGMLDLHRKVFGSSYK